MFEELYTPIPDLAKYFDRINLKCPVSCDLESLNSIILAHQYNVPFENLDIHDDHLPISISIEILFEKIVTRKRGGYCFELNSLFSRALDACGYEVFSCLARDVLEDGSMFPAIHRLPIVTIDDTQYICDVGYGRVQPGCALKLEDGFTIIDNNKTFLVENIDKEERIWRVSFMSTGKNEWEPNIDFTLSKIEEVDFLAPNFFCCTDSKIKFVTDRIVNIRTKSGSMSIYNDIFTINENGEKTVTQIKDAEHLKQVLSSHFGIEK